MEYIFGGSIVPLQILQNGKLYRSTIFEELFPC